MAAVLHGSPIATFDVDFYYRRTASNLKRLAEALKEIHPTLRGAPPDLPFQLDAQSLALGANFTFNTDIGELDLLAWVEPIGSYEEVATHALEMEIAGVHLRIIGLDDLITIKRYLGRPKDQATLRQLEELKRLRGRSSDADLGDG